jgi:hypothetical protein
MEDLITTILPQMPVVGVLLAVFWVLRSDVNAAMARMEARLDKLIDHLIQDDK